MSVKAVLTTPEPGSMLRGASVTFAWTAIGGATYALQIGTSLGAYDLFSQAFTGTSATPTGLPTDGRALFVRVWTVVGAIWTPNDYTYTAWDGWNRGQGLYLYDDYAADQDLALFTVSSQRDGQVGLAVKNGTGSATGLAGGAYTGAQDLQYRVEIDSIAAGAEIGQATFRWRDGSVAGWNATGVTTSAAAVALNNGVTFAWTTGAGADCVVGDRWDFLTACFYGVRQLVDRNRDTAWRSKTLAAPEWIRRDLGSARRVTACVVDGHNCSAAATITLEANTSDAWGAPAFSMAIPWRDELIILLLDQTYRYWRLTVSDPANPDGYLEIAEWFLGGYFQPGTNYDRNWGQDLVATETIVTTDAGARRHLVQSGAQEFTLTYRLLDSADRAGFLALEAAVRDPAQLRARPFWFMRDSTLWEAVLVTLPARLQIRAPYLERFDIALPLQGVPRTVR